MVGAWFDSTPGTNLLIHLKNLMIMKAKVTKKQVMSSYSNILKLSYCELQRLLNRFYPQYYTRGINGWNADIYIIDGMCIVTGYNPFGGEFPSSDEIDRVEKEYQELKELHLSYEDETKKVINLLRSLLK